MAAIAFNQTSSAPAPMPAPPGIHGAKPAYLRPLPSGDDFEARLARLGSSIVYPRGAIVIEEGETAHYVYKVVAGALRAVRLLPDGRRYIMNFLLPADFFGLAGTRLMTDTIEAIVETTVVRYPRATLNELLASDSQMSRGFLHLVCDELSAVQDRLLLLGRKNALGRIASFLLTIANRRGNVSARTLDLPMKRSDVADYLGLTVETVSRALTRLRKLGIIDVPTVQHVVLVKPDVLARIAAGDAKDS